MVGAMLRRSMRVNEFNALPSTVATRAVAPGGTDLRRHEVRSAGDHAAPARRGCRCGVRRVRRRYIAFAAQCLAMNSSWVGITRMQLAITPRMLSMYSAILSSGYTSTSA